jgi:hypothetical protein
MNKIKKLEKWKIKANEARARKGKPLKFIDTKSPLINETLIERIERKQIEARRKWLLSNPSVSKKNDAIYISENLKNTCNRAKDWYSR